MDDIAQRLAAEKSPGDDTEPSAAAALARVRGRYPRYTRDRLAAFSRRLRRAIWPESSAAALIEAAGPVGRIGFEEAQALTFRPVSIGQPLGPLWSSWWFRVSVEIPRDWAGARVDLHWDSASEALLWLDGRSCRGLNIGRPMAPIVAKARGGERLILLVEVACNRAFGADEGGVRGGGRDDPYRLIACEVRRFDEEAWALFQDFDVLRQLEADRAPDQRPLSTGGIALATLRPALDTTWAGRLLHDLNAVCNRLDPKDKATWPAAREILERLLAVRNGGVCHELSAIGHAHIDTAWLWPIEETWRKCQRSFATAVALMDAYPQFRFAASQACQYVAIEERDPDLFARILAKVRQGQWIPIGGSWVEPDCNLPSGEAMCRQFLYGQRYFERTFGARSRVFWNPDVFGYAGQLPQLMREAGMDRFLTQKLSWNRFTAPPHHSFHWRGIDGSQVLTHFPPADTYNGSAQIAELRYHAANYKDADRSQDGLYLFGFGDGGGGPTEEMVERLARVADLLGAPLTAIRSPDAFFDRLESAGAELATVEGELYFEYHRGTYTSQAEVKRLNRLVEGRLQTLEWLCALCWRAGAAHPGRDQVEALWRVLLTSQFHDILPGSSIAEVYARTVPELESLAARCAGLIQQLLKALEPDRGEDRGEDATTPVNPTGFARTEVATTPAGELAFVGAPAFAAGRVSECPDQVGACRRDERIVLENGALRAIIGREGSLISILHKASGREALGGVGGRILLFEDRPTNHEAWDIDPFALEAPRAPPAADRCEILREGPLRAVVRIERRLGAASSLVQDVILDAGSPQLEFDATLDWSERRTLVKAVFETSVRAPLATYETLFGAVQRPTHASTDADLAQFEVPGHRWADLSEPGFGVSLLSDARYGFSTFDGIMGLSLVRGPLSPDPGADVGRHRFRYALYPHEGDWRSAGTVGRAAAFNRPLLWTRTPTGPAFDAPLVASTSPHVVVDTIKPAEDGEGLVVRLYEASGGARRARLIFAHAPRAVFTSNTLEDRLEARTVDNGAIEVVLRGFQILTLRVL